MITRRLRPVRAFAAFLVVLQAFLLPRSGVGSDRGTERDRVRAEEQLERLAAHLEAFQADPDRRVPPEILREARAVVVVRETRAGFILGGKGGRGVLLVRGADKAWSAPAFVRTREGGVGLQAGWQQATFIQVLMSQAAIDAIRTNRFRFGVGLRVTSGPRSIGDEAKTRSAGADVLLYADTGGLYGGLAFEAGSLRPDEGLNRDLYGRETEAVLFGVRPAATPGGRRLAGLLEAGGKGAVP